MVWARFLMVALLLASGPVSAQRGAQDPSGLWTTFDDDSGQVSGQVRIILQGQTVSGRIAQILDPALAHGRCDRCTDDRKGQPMVGLEIIRGLHRDDDGDWSGGTVLDPKTGDTYRVSLRLADGGRKLVVRGSILGGLIGRSQTWLRADPP